MWKESRSRLTDRPLRDFNFQAAILLPGFSLAETAPIMVNFKKDKNQKGKVLL